MNEMINKYIEGLSPELQEKARKCKTKDELNEFIRDNELELPEEALELVAGGCTKTSEVYKRGDLVAGAVCPECKGQLYYRDIRFKSYCRVTEPFSAVRLYCKRGECPSFNKWMFYYIGAPAAPYSNDKIERYEDSELYG